ncbi:biotin--[acetyl-CoA-carboxylase] ligase [Dyadobacter linearis]|uniref:biotin--[acetyl-CoA-carboxylase] ligase n=1 Tax=Dyadobacter linearis TaxID=2823330 RepID=UPI001E39D78B|nr:biotin--[acetyl-CoA-carboxylase] ligase [Dyadobacter sp. CECT 9623]
MIYLPTCHSTNDIAAEIVHAGLFSEGTIVITDDQLSGRGQRGTKWVANPGENLTFSIILAPQFLEIDNQFLISQTIALGIRSYVASYLAETQVKWPNDIQVNGKKICGILIENSIQGANLKSSIVGIGLNVNQLSFENSFATSLSTETEEAFVLSDEFQKLARHIDAYYLRLRSRKQDKELRDEYLNNLYGYSNDVKFSYQERIYSGRVSAVSKQGKLSVRLSTGEEIADLGLKEIVWIKS